MRNQTLSEWKQAGQYSYYQQTDVTSVYAAALILHPAHRTQYTRKNWKREWQTALASVKKLWETSYLDASTSGPTESPLHVREEECESESVNKLGQLLQSLKVVEKEDEYTAFTAQSLINVQIIWAQLVAPRWTASAMAKAIKDGYWYPLNSGHERRAWAGISGVRRIVSWDRMRLRA
jgi:hypothetical protein